jgi:hypothetical protein
MRSVYDIKWDIKMTKIALTVLNKELEKALPFHMLNKLILTQRAKGIDINVLEGVRNRSRKGKKMKWLRASVIIDSEIVVELWWRPNRHTWDLNDRRKHSWWDFEKQVKDREEHWNKINRKEDESCQM